MRVFRGALLVLALVAQSIVAHSTSATAQVTQPPAGEAASIRIDEPNTPVGGVGVSVPANLTIDPDGGIAQDAPLQLMAEIIVDEQPLADSSVSVSGAETTTVDTDAQGRFQVPPLDLGTWEQLTSPDGADFVLESPARSVPRSVLRCGR